VDTETTAAGDLTEDFEHLRTRIRVVGEARLEIPSGANPYDVRSTLIGVKVAFAGKVNLAHTNGIVSGTLKVNAIEIDSPLSDPVAVTYELGSAGVPLVYDLTPAS
jgi:hypothetical protein